MPVLQVQVQVQYMVADYASEEPKPFPWQSCFSTQDLVMRAYAFNRLDTYRCLRQRADNRLTLSMTGTQWHC